MCRRSFDFLGDLLYRSACEEANARSEQPLPTMKKNRGKILEPKHAIGPYGFMAIILDSEGNRVALQSES